MKIFTPIVFTAGIWVILSAISFAQPVAPQDAIAAGGMHVLAICQGDASINAWGLNFRGSCGDGSAIQRNSAVTVIGLGGVCWTDMRWQSVKAGKHFSVALSSAGSPTCGPGLVAGSVWTWGANNNGQMGAGGSDALNHSNPVRMNNGGMGNNTMVAIAAGYEHGLALKNDNTMKAWGRNDLGQCGIGNTTTPQTSAVNVDLTNLGGRTISKIAAGSHHSLILCSDGTLWAWGYNFYGQLGDGTTTDQLIPVQANLAALGGRTVTAIEGSGYNSFAVCSDGSLWAWGYNGNGELGNNDPNIPATPPGTPSSVPVQVVGPGGVGFLSSVIAVGHSPDAYGIIALKSDGTVWAWGYDDFGMLGNNTVANGTRIATPVQMMDPPGTGFLTGIKAVHMGTQYSFAAKNNGTLWTVGDNLEGQLGIGNTTSKDLPVQVTPVCTSILPVELISFNAIYKSGEVICEWKTAAEINNDYFLIQRSEDGKNWENAGTVNGAGNSSLEKKYEFIDKSEFAVRNPELLYYRIKQVDYDGKYEFFGPVSVSVSPSDEWELILQNIPAEKELTGTLIVPKDAQVVIEVIDFLGRTAQNDMFNAIKGLNFLQIDLSNIEQGAYFVKIYNQRNNIVKKFVVE